MLHDSHKNYNQSGTVDSQIFENFNYLLSLKTTHDLISIQQTVMRFPWNRLYNAVRLDKGNITIIR